MLTYPRFLGCIKPRKLAGNDAEVLAYLHSFARVWEPRELRVPIARRLAFIAPHPDDEAIGAGGLLLAHRDKSELHLINLFSGAGGGAVVDPEGPSDLNAVRSREFAASAAELGAASARQLNLDLLDPAARSAPLRDTRGSRCRRPRGRNSSLVPRRA